MSKLTKLNGKNFECFPLSWDTDYFGVKSARVNLKGIVKEDDKDRILEYCSQFQFTTISNMNNIKENNYWIGKKTNAFLTDMNIQFHKVLNYKPNHQAENAYVVNNCLRNEQIVEIARKSFQHSRFFNDSKLCQEKAKNIYLHWTECAFGQESKYFVICERDKQIAGYILCSLNEEQHYCVIELIAVDEKYQGQRVGKSLVQILETFVIDKGINIIKVGTQVNNISAAQFYSKMGFIYVSCGSVYHLWRKS